MKKELLYGYSILNFGENNYSYGMEAIIFDPKEVTPEKVNTLKQVYLHPTLPANGLEIFAVKGSEESYQKFLNACIDQDTTKKAFAKFGRPDINDIEGWKRIDREVEINKKKFKPWFEKES